MIPTARVEHYSLPMEWNVTSKNIDECDLPIRWPQYSFSMVIGVVSNNQLLLFIFLYHGSVFFFERSMIPSSVPRLLYGFKRKADGDIKVMKKETSVRSRCDFY